jgi:hypothetical protein
LQPTNTTTRFLDLAEHRAQPGVPLQDRSCFLHRVAALLRGRELGDGMASRAARQAQAELFRAPDLLTSLRRYR